MTGRAGRHLLASLLCVGLLALVAVGGASAAGPADYCETVSENESVVVGGVGDAAFTDEITLRSGSTLTVGYCAAGEPVESEWLSDGDGFEVGDRDGHTYTVAVTGENETVDFADHFADANRSAPDEALVVTVAGAAGDADGAGDDLGVDDDEVAAAYREYRTAVTEAENATAALNETTGAIEASEIDLSNEDELADANETVYSLQEDYETMTDTRAALLGRLRTAGANRTATGTVAAAEAVDDEYRRTEANVTAAANAYDGAVDAEVAGPRSTVRLSVLGSLGAGVALGLVAGAAVPLVAARRVKEKMKLSRDVSYDRKTALLPILLGVVAAAAGAAVLAVMVGLDPLLRVIA
ncbi:hypothetical protein [Halorubrum sp. LN27]|uniref:hypothetical protein n=1 Tax=Halorubrum sp. LN27 TaxID=2801032 RepID=UPI00190DE53E|nr:hypothetical protein [Halorubrum sp. LN27]